MISDPCATMTCPARKMQPLLTRPIDQRWAVIYTLIYTAATSI